MFKFTKYANGDQFWARDFYKICALNRKTHQILTQIK